MIELVDDEYGRIDVLINNAGIFSTLEMRPFDQIPLEEWEQVLRVNLTGPFLVRARRVAGDAARQMGPHHQYRVRRGAAGPAELFALHRHQVGADRHEPVDGARTGADDITVNAILPGATFTEIERKTVTPAQKERIVAMQCIPRPRCRRIWSARCCFSPPKRPPLSPVRALISTAG